MFLKDITKEANLSDNNDNSVGPSRPDMPQPVPVPTPNYTVQPVPTQASEQYSVEPENVEKPDTGQYKIPEVVKESYRSEAVTYHDEGKIANIGSGREKNSTFLSTVLFVLAGVALTSGVVVIGTNLPMILGSNPNASNSDVQNNPLSGQLLPSYEKMKNSGIQEYSVYSYGDTEVGSYSILSYYDPNVKAGVSCVDDCINDNPVPLDTEDSFSAFLPGKLYEKSSDYTFVEIEKSKLVLTPVNPISNVKEIILSLEDGLIVSAEGVDKDGVKWSTVIDYKVDSKGKDLMKEIGY